MATLVLRHFLWEMMRSCQNATNTPVAIGAAPTGQRYEFGALVAMAIAADSGWRSLYCGADLRAEEIASAAAQKQARAAVLSIARTADGVHLKREVKRLRRILPRNCSLIIGGRGAEAIRPILKGTELIMMRDAKDLRSILKGLLVSGQWRPKGAPEDSRCARPEHVAGCTASVMGT
jgi:methanogenic corrinoid protein MtbC1